MGRPTHHMPGYRTRAGPSLPLFPSVLLQLPFHTRPFLFSLVSGAVAAAATARRLQTSVPNSVDRLDGAVDGSYTPIFAEKTFQDLGTVFVIDTGLRCAHTRGVFVSLCLCGSVSMCLCAVFLCLPSFLVCLPVFVFVFVFRLHVFLLPASASGILFLGLGSADHVEFAGETEVRIRQGYDFVDDDDSEFFWVCFCACVCFVLLCLFTVPRLCPRAVFRPR